MEVAKTHFDKKVSFTKITCYFYIYVWKDITFGYLYFCTFLFYKPPTVFIYLPSYMSCNANNVIHVQTKNMVQNCNTTITAHNFFY